MNQVFFDMAEQHRQDLLSAAAHDRRAALHRASQPQQRMHAAMLVWMGERFIVWGWRLRARYGRVEHGGAL
jgi:hypothetical protein